MAYYKDYGDDDIYEEFNDENQENINFGDITENISDYSYENHPEVIKLHEYINREYRRDKIMMLIPKKLRQILYVYKKIKKLFNEHDDEYTLKIDFDESICGIDANIIFESEDFGTSVNSFPIYRDIINNIDSISYYPMANKKIRTCYTINEVYIEIKQ